MCALFGWLDFKGKIKHKYLKKLTQALANAAEERGIDASGISYVKNGKVNICKKAKPAHKVKFDFPMGTTAIMGHTRMTTQGSAKFNYNNHPFYGKADKAFAFAHNGILHNDLSLRKTYNLPKTSIETDSYVAVQLIEKSGKLDFASLKSMAEDVSGNFVFTLLDENNTLYFVKGNNPLYLLCFERIGLYVYASTKSIMDNALKEVGMQFEKFTHISIAKGDILSIDRNGRIEKSTFTPENYGIYDSSIHGALYDWHDEYEQLLLDVCGSFGVSEEDVELMLEFGYEPYEIEEMLMDGDLIRATVSELKYF